MLKYFVQIITFSLFSTIAFSQVKLTENEKLLLNVQTSEYEKGVEFYKNMYNLDSEDFTTNKHFQRWNYFWGKRLNSQTQPDINEVLKEINSEQIKAKQNQLLTSGINWEAFGPFITPENNDGLGRINVIRFHPQNSRIIYVGAATGGAWVSYDNAQTWNLLPTTDFLSLSVSDIRISKNNPNIIYIATSDANAASAIIGPVYGVGLLKSTNGGQSFNATGKFHDLSDRVFTSKVMLHPENDDILWVATNSGVYKSTDGGDNFDNIGPQVFVKDIELHPTNPDIIYISTLNMGGSVATVYKSEEGGNNWKVVQSYSDAVRAELAVTPAMPNRLVSIVSQTRPFSFHSYNYSEDSGENWTLQSHKDNHVNVLGRNRGVYPPPDTRVTDQGWFDLCVALSPKNPNYTMVGGITLWQSGNTGRNFQELIGDYHVDQHYIEFTPTGDTMYIGNDGGIYRFIPSTGNLQFVTNGMNITQFYKHSVNPNNNNMVIGGSQDNSSILKRTDGKWYLVRGGDGMDCHFDPKDPRYVYASSQNGNFSYSTNTGTSFRSSISRNFTDEEAAWVTPMAIDPIKTGYVYAGYENVWRSTTHGNANSWERISNFGSTSTLEIIAISKSNSDYIYVSDGGSIRYTTNAGSSWQILPSPTSSLTGIEVHPENPEKIYVTASNYTRANKVFEYNSIEKKWDNISGNLPNVPVNVIKFQEDSPNRLFIGTDIGVYYTDYDSRYWERYGKGLPFTLVNDIDIQVNTNKIFIASYGRGIWSADLINCNLEKLEIELLGDQEFCFGDSVEVRLVSQVDNPEEILWSTGEKGPSIWVKDKGSYAVVGSSFGNCNQKSNFIEINTISVVEVNLRSTKGEFLCLGDSTRLSANFGQPEYIWENGQTGLGRWVYEPGTYSIKVRNNNGCFSYDTITIREKNIEVPTIELIDEVLSTSVPGNIQWYFNGIAVEGANSSTFIPEENGDVTVEHIDGACSELSDAYFYNMASVKASELFKVYPNPSKGIVNIQLTEKVTTNVKVELVDLNGNKVDFSNVNLFKSNGLIELNLTEFIDGAYLINIKVNNQIFTSKILLNK